MSKILSGGRYFHMEARVSPALPSPPFPLSYSPRALETARGGSRIGREWASVGARVSWIASERLGRSGRETAHSMRRNGETMMAAVTWRYVPRVTCHVPPREPFEKCCVRAAAQTGSGREPKLSGQKRLGLNCVSLGESALRDQNCAPRGQFYCFQPSAL